MERQNNTDIDLGEKGGKKVFVCERKMERDIPRQTQVQREYGRLERKRETLKLSKDNRRQRKMERDIPRKTWVQRQKKMERDIPRQTQVQRQKKMQRDIPRQTLGTEGICTARKKETYVQR